MQNRLINLLHIGWAYQCCEPYIILEEALNPTITIINKEKRSKSLNNPAL